MNIRLINRNIESVIKEACRYFSVITITGPRQSWWRLHAGGGSAKLSAGVHLRLRDHEVAPKVNRSRVLILSSIHYLIS